MKRDRKGIDMATIEEIEARTREQVIDILRRYGLGKVRRRKMHDYIEAKKICFDGMAINSRIYDTQIEWICGYLMI